MNSSDINFEVQGILVLDISLDMYYHSFKTVMHILSTDDDLFLWLVLDTDRVLVDSSTM